MFLSLRAFLSVFLFLVNLTKNWSRDQFFVIVTKFWSRWQFQDSFYFHHVWCKPCSPCMVKIWCMFYFHHKYHQVLQHDYHGENKILCKAFLIFTMKKPWKLDDPFSFAPRKKWINCACSNNLKTCLGEKCIFWRMFEWSKWSN